MTKTNVSHGSSTLKCPDCHRRHSSTLAVVASGHIKGLLVFNGTAACGNCGCSWAATVTQPCQHANKRQFFLKMVAGSHLAFLNLYRFACPDCRKVWEDSVWEDS